MTGSLRVWPLVFPGLVPLWKKDPSGVGLSRQCWLRAPVQSPRKSRHPRSAPEALGLPGQTRPPFSTALCSPHLPRITVLGAQGSASLNLRKHQESVRICQVQGLWLKSSHYLHHFLPRCLEVWLPKLFC